MSEELELKGKFLSAKKLKLSKKQRCALLKTLAWLEAGKLDHENERNLTFDMKHWNQGSYTRNGKNCGTVCCIGGAASILGDNAMYAFMRGYITKELGNLFYPGGGATGLGWVDEGKKHPGWSASTAQAAVALRGYLETGKTDWDAAMLTPSNRRAK